MNFSIPKRDEVPNEHKWDLSALFPADEAWEEALHSLGEMQAGIGALTSKIHSSKEDFLVVLGAYKDYLRLDERLAYYADLKVTEDEGGSPARDRFARYVGIATKGQAAWAWLIPAIQALPESFLDGCFADSRFGDYLVFLKKLSRFKPHILSEKEERLVALQAETNHIAQETFGILTNVDFDFGKLRTDEGLLPLSQSTFSAFMRNRDRNTRKKAYLKFYGVYDRHKTTLASLYAGSVKLDKYQAQIRGYNSARDQALFSRQCAGIRL